MLLAAGDVTHLGSSSGRLVFGEEPKKPGTWRGRRLLLLDEKPAFELSFWCGTCPFIFERKEGANDTASLEAMQERLASGIDGLDADVISTYGELLAEGRYLPMLLTVEPRLVQPIKAGDYFAEEQVATWGVDSFWGLPEYPRTPYYRTFQTAVDDNAHLYEFIVPMVPPTWNSAAKVDEHMARLANSSAPTAIAVSTLDVCEPAMADDATDYYAHWGLTHFLLDGHHKVLAAATAERSLSLLCLLSLDASLAAEEDVLRVPQLVTQPANRRAGI